MQNLLLYAVTEQTEAELVMARANPNDRHFGMLHWQGAKVRKQDEAAQADAQDDAELKALENTLKQRPLKPNSP